MSIEVEINKETIEAEKQSKILTIKKMILNKNIPEMSKPYNFHEFVSYSKFHNLSQDEGTNIIPSKIKPIQNDNPGPGQYDILHDDSLNSRQQSSKSSHNNANLNSDYRVVSIPTRDQKYGYEYDENGAIKMSHSPLDLQSPNNQKIKNSRKRNGKVIKSAIKRYSGKNTNDNTLISDTNRNDITSITNILTNSNGSRVQSSKPFNDDKLIPQKMNEKEKFNNDILNEEAKKRRRTNMYDKSKIYKSLHVGKSHHKKYSSIIEEILNSSYFSSTPGPGYYSSIDLPNQQYYFGVNYQNFGSLFPRICSLDSNGNSSVPILDNYPGPGEYEIVRKKERNSQNNNKNKLLFKRVYGPNKHLIKDIKILKEKQEQLLGPGRYDTYDKMREVEKEKSYINYNFGTFERRFNNIAYKKDDNTPGPGQYNLIKCFDKKENQKNHPKIAKELTVMETNEEEYPKYEVPGVGTYNPGLANTIEYQVKMKESIKIPKKKNTKIILEEKKRIEKINKIKQEQIEKNKNLGPGCYFNNHIKPNNSINISAPFMSNVPRKVGGYLQSTPNNIIESQQIDDNQINQYHQWIKKSFNLLYV